MDAKPYTAEEQAEMRAGGYCPGVSGPWICMERMWSTLDAAEARAEEAERRMSKVNNEFLGSEGYCPDHFMETMEAIWATKERSRALARCRGLLGETDKALGQMLDSHEDMMMKKTVRAFDRIRKKNAAELEKAP